MSDNATKQHILAAAIPILAQQGYEGASIRVIAAAAGVQASVIYHYFPDKAALLRAVRLHVNSELDAALYALPAAHSPAAMLRQRLDFQFDYIEHIVCLLQYFMAAKADFPAQPGGSGGYVPERAYRHMREVIDRGLAEGAYRSADPAFDAKVLTHTVNGFLMEYYPHPTPRTDQQALVERLADFVERALGART